LYEDWTGKYDPKAHKTSHTVIRVMMRDKIHPRKQKWWKEEEESEVGLWDEVGGQMEW